MKIEAYDSYQFVEVYIVTERRDGCVYRTKKIGYARQSRPRKENEIYVSLSMRPDTTIEVEIME